MKGKHTQAGLLVELTSGDETRAEAAAVRLAESGEQVLDLLEPLLQSAEGDRRWWAVRTLGQMSSPPIARLTQALEDPSAEVRSAAALALVIHPSSEAIPALVRSLEDVDPMVTGLAGNALVAIGNEAVPALLEMYPHASDRARIPCMRALAEIKDHRAIRLMMDAMDQGSAALHYWAQEGLERLGLNMVYIKPE